MLYTLLDTISYYGQLLDKAKSLFTLIKDNLAISRLFCPVDF